MSRPRILTKVVVAFAAILLGAVALPLAAGAAPPPSSPPTISADQAPTITSITATGGNVTVTWTNDAPDATSIDVILYDSNGNVLEDDNVDPTETTDTFDGVADGGAYSVDVIANTPGGALDPGASSPFDLYLGNYVVDQSPTITSITATGGDVTASWTNDAPDATSIDVILYDSIGNVLEDDNVLPTTTTDTIDGVADGGGYTLDVIANTPGGPLDPGSSAPFDLYLGNFVVDQPPTITSITATGGNITVIWTNDAPDATSIDVILYDSNGNVLEDDNVDPTETTDTIDGVADGGGYTIDVVTNTPGGPQDPGASAPFDLADGSYSSDQPATISSITCTGGAVTVAWTANATDAIGFDVILLDASGDVVEDDSLGATASMDTLASVADGDGYEVEVVTHTPIGDFTATSGTLDILNGSLVPVPIVDPVPVVSPSPIVVPASTVTVTPIDGGASGWTVSWPELASAPTFGQYVVTDDQGDTCTAAPTGVAGTSLSCTLAPLSDGSTTLTGVVVTFEPDLLFAAATSTAHAGTATVHPTTAPTGTPKPANKTTTKGSSKPTTGVTPTAAAVRGASGFSDGWWALIGASLLLAALAFAARLRVRHPELRTIPVKNEDDGH